jgi:multidrug resistance efflux pump
MKRIKLSNGITIAAGTGLLFFSVFLWTTFINVKSRDSIIEVKTLAIKSPIAGVISNLDVVAGDVVNNKQSLFEVNNNIIPKPRVGDLEIELSRLQSELASAENKKVRDTILVNESRVDQNNQFTLQVQRQTEELNTLKRSKTQAIQEAEFAKREYLRKKALYDQGAYAFDLVDRAETTMKKANEEIRLIQNRIQAQEKVLQAAQRNLTLIATRGGADPEARLRDSLIASLETEDNIALYKFKIKELNRQIETAKKEYIQSTFAKLLSPVNGVVWKVDLQSGSGVKEQENVLYLLDCNRRWVNAYVREGDLKRIHIGQRAEIKLFGSEQTLSGRVSLVRSGVGRTSEGSDFLPLLPINIYRESQVKISIDPTQNLKDEAGKMCYSGHTGKVTFL